MNGGMTKIKFFHGASVNDVIQQQTKGTIFPTITTWQQSDQRIGFPEVMDSLSCFNSAVNTNYRFCLRLSIPNSFNLQESKRPSIKGGVVLWGGEDISYNTTPPKTHKWKRLFWQTLSTNKVSLLMAQGSWSFLKLRGDIFHLPVNFLSLVLTKGKVKETWLFKLCL